MIDPFYTNPNLAQQYIKDLVNQYPDPNILFVEPSAGAGAFTKPLLHLNKKVRGLDLDPKSDEIMSGNFFNPHNLFAGIHSKIIVIGNPPFGRNTSLATKFFNHSAEYADLVAFILPRSFRKQSIWQRLDKRFHLQTDQDVPVNSFILNDNTYHVPCVWQIWKKGKIRTIQSVPKIDHLIKFVKKSKADFAVRRVGSKAGKVYTKLDLLPESSFYFLKSIHPNAAKLFKKINWQKLSSQTVGPRSISKAEIAISLNNLI